MKDNKLNNFVKVKETADWVKLKKQVKVINNKVITEDGEIIEGVTVIEKPNQFIVDIK